MGLIGIKGVISGAVLVLLLAVFLNWPPPNMSPRLISWVHSGKYFTYKGSNIFYRDDKGRKEGLTVLCLHGFPSFSYDFIKVWPALTGKFGRVIAPDFIGYGFSDKPVDHDYSIMEQADIVEALLARLKITSVHIFAHDYGDTVAQELLHRYESRKEAGSLEIHVVIRSLCMMNGGMFPETNTPRPGQKLLLVPGVGAVLSRLTFFYSFRRGFSEVFGAKTQPTPEEFQDYWAGTVVNDGHKVIYKLLAYIAERWANRDRWVGVLQRTSVPVHTIYGPADPANPPPFEDLYRKIIPNPSLTVLEKDISHYPHVEVPSTTMQDYFKFLKTLPFE